MRKYDLMGMLELYFSFISPNLPLLRLRFPCGKTDKSTNGWQLLLVLVK